MTTPPSLFDASFGLEEAAIFLPKLKKKIDRKMKLLYETDIDVLTPFLSFSKRYQIVIADKDFFSEHIFLIYFI